MIEAFGRMMARSHERQAKWWIEHPNRMFLLFLISVVVRVTRREYHKNDNFKNAVDERIDALRTHFS